MQKLKKKISFFRKKISANFNDYKRFEEYGSRFFERNNGLGDIENWGIFVSKTLKYLQFFYRSPYYRYLKGFVKKKFEKNRKKKKLHICKNKIKISFFRKKISANLNDYKRFEESGSRFFERNNRTPKAQDFTAAVMALFLPFTPRPSSPYPPRKYALRNHPDKSLYPL
ncbi:hypothetical protein LXL04_039165 [Taraxacum kok-saghyz]